MTALFIDGIGTFTSVGLNVGQTMGSLRTKLERPAELEVYGTDGNPIIAAPSTALADGVLGEERVIAMGGAALLECARGREVEAAPLLLCCSEQDQVSIDADWLLRRLPEAASVEVDRKQSRAFFGGHAAIVEALRYADEILRSGRARGCYVGATESLIEVDRLMRLQRKRRIKNEDVSDGLRPGEAAAFLHVAGRQQPTSLARISGLGIADEPAVRDHKPNTGVGLARAMRAALTDAHTTMEPVDFLASDLNGERVRFTELAFAITRLRFFKKDAMHAWCAAESVGEIGAAIGPLSLAYIAFMMRAGGAPAPAGMYVGGSEGGLRGAAILTGISHGR